jgi:zinc protease
MLEPPVANCTAPRAPHPNTDLPAVALPAKPRVYLIDQPGAVQANIVAAQLLPSSKDPGTVDMEFANSIFGGDFTARLNMNLREDKHWSYGSYSGAGNALGQRLWMASAPVQIDKTIESIQEMRKEIGDFASGKRAVTDEEVARLQAINTRTLPGTFETARAVLSTVGSINRYGRPDDFVVWRKGRIEAMTPASVQAVATADFHPEAMTWIVVGDRSKIEEGVRKLGIGEVTVIDADGKVVK